MDNHALRPIEISYVHDGVTVTHYHYPPQFVGYPHQHQNAITPQMFAELNIGMIPTTRHSHPPNPYRPPITPATVPNQPPPIEFINMPRIEKSQKRPHHRQTIWRKKKQLLKYMEKVRRLERELDALTVSIK